MTIEHVNITGSNIHEPKGAAAATANKVYVTDGAASGAWQQVTADEIDTTSIKNLNREVITLDVGDMSSVESHFVVSPFAGNIIAIYSVIDVPIATADTTLTAKIGGTAITDGLITVAFSGSAAGDVDSVTPSANNTVSAGQAIEVLCGGETTTSAAHAHMTFVIDIS